MMNNVTNELTPRLRELRGTIGKFDTTLNSVNAVVGAQNQRELAEALHSLNNSAKNIEQLTSTLSKESTQITAILKNAQSFTASLASQNDTIKLLLANANKLMRQLGNAPVEKTVTELQSTIVQVKEVIAKINKGEGSLGLLINDKELHRNLNSSLHSLDSLMTDIKAHPTRYINVTVFGSKKKS
jgi:phospholipid/cholesterol/gamma-HCH transport system substrate-binding protein